MLNKLQLDFASFGSAIDSKIVQDLYNTGTIDFSRQINGSNLYDFLYTKVIHPLRTWRTFVFNHMIQ